MNYYNIICVLFFLALPIRNTQSTPYPVSKYKVINKASKISKVWVLDNKDSEYYHIKLENIKSRHILTNVNTTFDENTNKIRVISNSLDTTYYSMEVIKLPENRVKYLNDTSAKIAMVYAELGGSILSDYDNTLSEALVISASMDNRLKVDSIKSNKFVKDYMRSIYHDKPYQSLYTKKQYNAAFCKAYQSFKYGYNKRTRKELKKRIGLCAVYNSVFNPVHKLEEMGMYDAKFILSFCHAGDPSLWKSRYLDFTMLKTNKMKHIITSVPLEKYLI